ncbi:type IV secretory system conjugative DNA transfer family protein, partial [Xanthomonas campestris]
KSHTTGKQSSVSYSETEQRRALMLPQELKAMGFDKEVFLYEGIPSPVLCEKIKYYEDAYFTKRLLPKVKIEAVKMALA